jgi:hypothetical protein
VKTGRHLNPSGEGASTRSGGAGSEVRRRGSDGGGVEGMRACERVRDGEIDESLGFWFFS